MSILDGLQMIVPLTCERMALAEGDDKCQTQQEGAGGQPKPLFGG